MKSPLNPIGTKREVGWETRGLRGWENHILLVIGASYGPLNIIVSNPAGIVHPERLVALILLIWVANLLGVALLLHLGLSDFAAAAASFLLTILFMSGGVLNRFVGLPALYLILGAVAIMAVWVVMRLQQAVILKAMVWGLAVALAAQPAVNLVESWSEVDGESVVRQADLSLAMSTRPDIFLIVLDGYPGDAAMHSDELPGGSVEIDRELKDLGFEVPGSAWSSYWKTHLAIPAILDMGYPVTSANRDTSTAAFHEVISSGGRLNAVLESNGYSSYIVESGWTGSSCGEMIDRCIPSPLMDEAMYLTLRDSVAAPALGSFGGPFVNGVKSTMDWLSEHGPSISRSESSDFVFAHLLAPHPPFVLREDCSMVESAAGFEPWFSHGDRALEVREERLVDQMDCVDHFMLDFARSIESDDVVVFVSDHGTDRRRQSSARTLSWSDEAIIERLNVFTAARLPSGCSTGQEILTVNLMLRVLSCLSGSSPVLNPRRMWINPMQELNASLVNDLMSMQRRG